MFAIDHGYFMGPTSGLENPRETIVPLLPYADSLMLSRGILQNSIPKPPIYLLYCTFQVVIASSIKIYPMKNYVYPLKMQFA
jgi:hypothetical protein